MKMASILEEFAYGNVSPHAQALTRDARYREATELMERIEQKLLNRLEADDRELFQTDLDAQDEADQFEFVGCFTYGFRLGLAMTAESFVRMDDLYAHGEEL